MNRGLRSPRLVLSCAFGPIHFAGTSIIFTIRVGVVVTFDKSVFARLGVICPVSPSEAGLVLELLVEQLEGTV